MEVLAAQQPPSAQPTPGIPVCFPYRQNARLAVSAPHLPTAPSRGRPSGKTRRSHKTLGKHRFGSMIGQREEAALREWGRKEELDQFPLHAALISVSSSRLLFTKTRLNIKIQLRDRCTLVEHDSFNGVNLLCTKRVGESLSSVHPSRESPDQYLQATSLLSVIQIHWLLCKLH